jgi:branched-chain amino acid transport system substrate-binding protein
MTHTVGLSAFAGVVLSSALLAAQIHPSAPEEHPPATSQIIVGVSNVQSGPSRSLGQNLLRGSTAYFDLVNARGGIYGRTISIVLKDDKYEPDPAVQNTNELIEKEKAFFLFDYVGTPTLTRVLPLLKYYEKEKIVNVSPFTGADPQRKPPYDKFVFNIRASYREETRALVRYLYGKGYRRIGFLGQADAYGKSGEIGVTDALAELNLKPVETVSYKRNQPFETDMSAQVRILRQAGTDAVIAVGVYGPCGAFIRDARMAGWNVPVANVSFVGAEVLLDKLQAASKTAGRDLTANLINSQVVPSPGDQRYRLVSDYRAHLTSENYGFVTLEGWLNAVVVTEALARAGPSPSREDFIRAMESLHGWDPGLGVNLEFSSTSHQGLHRVWLTRTENGHWVPEEAPESAK